jgi:signal transduction histidine kinase
MALLFVVTSVVVAVASYLALRASFRAFPDPPSTLGEALGLPAPQRPEDIELIRQLDTVVEQERRAVERAALRAQAQRSALVVALVLPAAALVAGLLTRRAVRPVRQIGEVAQRISEENLHERIGPLGRNDELTALATTFDGMLARLEAAFEAQRSFAAHASHELRTPLATLRAEADVVAAEPAAPPEARHLAAVTRTAVARTDALLEGLLVLARAQSGATRRDRVDLAGVCGDAVAELVGQATGANVAVDLELADAEVVGDRALLAAMTTNLVRNAILHNDVRGQVVVTVDSAGGDARVVVTNTGERLSAADLEALTRPFARGASAPEGGHGIGSAVVQAVVAAHGGRFSAQARPGGGLVTEVRIPAAR